MTEQPRQPAPGAGVGGAPMGSADRVVALTQELIRRTVALAGELTTASGLNPSDVGALRALDAAAGEGIAVNTLGVKLGLSSGAVTALVDRLERLELVRRDRDDRDRRKVIVTLAPRAKAFGAEHLSPLARAIQGSIAELDTAELKAVQHFLEEVLDRHQPTTASRTSAAPRTAPRSGSRSERR